MGWPRRTRWRTGPNPPRITVLESSPRLGGKLAGAELEGVPVDLGAESVLARRPEAVDLIRAVGLGADLVHPATTSAGLWIGDRIRAIPPTVMGVPTPRRTRRSTYWAAEAAAKVAAEPILSEPPPSRTWRSADSLPSGWLVRGDRSAGRSAARWGVRRPG